MTTQRRRLNPARVSADTRSSKPRRDRPTDAALRAIRRAQTFFLAFFFPLKLFMFLVLVFFFLLFSLIFFVLSPSFIFLSSPLFSLLSLSISLYLSPSLVTRERLSSSGSTEILEASKSESLEASKFEVLSRDTRHPSRRCRILIPESETDISVRHQLK